MKRRHVVWCGCSGCYTKRGGRPEYLDPEQYKNVLKANQEIPPEVLRPMRSAEPSRFQRAGTNTKAKRRIVSVRPKHGMS